MISEERVRRMFQLAVYDEHKRKKKKEKKTTQYYQKDYISMEMIKSFVYGTIAFLIIIGMLGIYLMQKETEWLDTTRSIVGLVIVLAILYIAFIVAFLILTYKVYSARYANEKLRLKEYQKILQEVNELYEEEDAGRTLDEWRDVE